MEFTFALHVLFLAPVPCRIRRQKEKLPTIWSGAFYPALSYFCLAAIVGVRELNFWVRNGTRCDLSAIKTESVNL